MKDPELLAPAGSMESIYAACACGADAVYIGGESFSARANAVNFTDEQIAEAVEYCHLRGVKVHRAMNTVIFDSEIDSFAKAAVRSAELGIDALIVQDWGGARVIRRLLPDMPIHASTQMTIHTPEGARMAAELGFSRVVPARELSLEQIKAICDTGIETEVFVHGALCMCVSGQCYMSAMIGSRSANRGQCAQACRLPFNAAGDFSERHDLSLKDMSHILRIDELRKAGVASLKIEGRMKRAEYTAAAVTACRQALDGEKPDMERLKAVFSRSGFTDGYISGKTGADMFGYRRKDDVTAAADVLPELKELYRTEKPRCPLDMHLEMNEGEPSALTAKCGKNYVTVYGDVPQQAVNRPADLEYASKQLSKLGGTVYYAGEITVDIGDGLMLPASSMNALRRAAVGKMNVKLIESEKPKYTVNDDYYEEFGSVYVEPKKIYTRAHIRRKNQLEAALRAADYVIMPADECPIEGYDTGRIYAAPPRYITDEQAVYSRLKELKAAGYTHLFCNNIAHIRMGRELGFTMHGGFGLNVLNSYSAAAMKDMGLSDITASFEMKLHDISALADIVGIAMIISGKLPLMLVRNCPIKQAVGCGKCGGSITDRTGRQFEVVCDRKKREYSEILNCDTLYMADRKNEIHGVTFYDMLFYNESANGILSFAEKIRKGEKPEKGITRGLYYRGII